jgi:uncharacterized protein YuzE
MKVEYDTESDCISLRLSNEKAYETVEINANILVDLSYRNRKPVAVEVLDASEFVSRLFAKRIDRETVKKKLRACLKRNGRAELTLDFELGKERHAYAIPKAYESPILAV